MEDPDRLRERLDADEMERFYGFEEEGDDPDDPYRECGGVFAPGTEECDFCPHYETCAGRDGE